MNKAFLDYFRCPEGYGEFCLLAEPSTPAGYFRFGSAVAYGQLSTGVCAERSSGQLCDAMQNVEISKPLLRLPFDVNSVVDNLRLERYVQDSGSGGWNGHFKAMLKD